MSLNMQGECHKSIHTYGPPTRTWWKEAVIYQVYPRSFLDSNGDGIGDLEGIISGLDYIGSLGVDVVWINPVYVSPGIDNGYDISDFRAIQPQFGTMEDLQRLIDAIHERKMRIIMDMVVNHTSDEHEWFRQARSSRDNPYYTFYHWWPAEKGPPPYRCGFFDPAGEGWMYNEATDSYYLHYFSLHQPDLNWENPALRRQIYEMLRFWLDKGVDGFRMDAITFISKDPAWPEITRVILKEKYYDDWGHYYATGPRLHEYLRELHDEVLKGRDAVIIGEASGVLAGRALDFVGEDRMELDMLYHFEGISVGYLPGQFKKLDPAGYSVADFKRIYTCWDEILDNKGWNALYLGNHDQPRMVSRWGDDREPFRVVSAKMLFTFLLTMRGTPSLYNGDELGMTNIRFKRIGEYKDIETQQVYQKIKDSGGDTAAFLRDQELVARDNSRTPFQWSGETNAGFTAGQPWMRVNDNFHFINREVQEGDPGSVLQYVRMLIGLRKEKEVLVYGNYTLVDPENPYVFAYYREWAGVRYLILLNFTKEEQNIPCDIPSGAFLLINNYEEIGSRLAPYQAVVFSIGEGRMPAMRS